MNRKYYIVFCPKKNITWWNWLLDSRLFHCFLITHVSKTSSISIHPSNNGIYIKSYTVNAEKVALSCKDCDIIECYSSIARDVKVRGIKTCVSIVKDFIGVRDFFVITAKQLYNYLKKEKNHGEAFRVWRRR